MRDVKIFAGVILAAALLATGTFFANKFVGEHVFPELVSHPQKAVKKQDREAEKRMLENRGQFIKDCMVGISPKVEREYFTALQNCEGGSKSAYPEPI